MQANLAIAPSEPNRLIASVAMMDGIKLYQSTDGGGNWSVLTDDPRPNLRVGGGGELPVLSFDPKNPEII